MAEERRNLGLTQARSANSMAQQISQSTSTSSSRHLSQSNFQSRAIQTQAGAASSTIQMGVPSFPAYPVSYNQRSTNHSGHVSQMRSPMFESTGQQIQVLQGGTSFPAHPTPISYGQPRIHLGNDPAPQLFQSTGAQTEGLQFAGAEGFPSRLYTFVYNQYPDGNFAGDIFLRQETLRWMGAIIQTDAVSFMASINQYRAPRSFSGQPSRAQTQAGAGNSMASQIEQGITNSSRQYSVPGIAQEGEVQIPAAVGTFNGAHTHPQMFPSTQASARNSMASQIEQGILTNSSRQYSVLGIEPEREVQIQAAVGISNGVHTHPQMFQSTRASAQNSMASQIEQGILTNSSRQYSVPGHAIAQERGSQIQAAVGPSNVTHSHPQMFISTRAQSPASTQNSTASQIEQGMLTNSSRQNSLPGRGIARERGAQIQAAIGTSRDTHNNPQMFQSTQAQTQVSARNPMASQIERGILTNSYRQNSFPAHGIAQERGAQIQAAVGASSGTHNDSQMFQSTRTQTRTSARNSMASQIERGILTNSSRQNSLPGHWIAQERGVQNQAAVGTSNVTHNNPQMFQSTRARIRALLLANLPRFPHFSYRVVLIYIENQIRGQTVFVPRTNPAMMPWRGAQIQASTPSFMASQSQNQTPRSFSGQSSGEQTRVGAPSFMASQNQYQTPRSFSGQPSGTQNQAGAPNFSEMPALINYLFRRRQDSTPNYGMAQERGSTEELENQTRGTQIQAQPEDYGGSGNPNGEGEIAEDIARSTS